MVLKAVFRQKSAFVIVKAEKANAWAGNRKASNVRLLNIGRFCNGPRPVRRKLRATTIRVSEVKPTEFSNKSQLFCSILSSILIDFYLNFIVAFAINLSYIIISVCDSNDSKSADSC